MTELEPLKKITKEPEKVQEVKKTETKQEEKSVEKVVEKQPETFNLLRKINGELFFELEFPTGKLVVSEGKCSQLIPEFKKMTAEQKETFLMQAAIFGANPFSVPPEIYPLPFKQQDNSTTYAPVISAKKYVEKGMENPKFDGMKSGIVVEKQDGSFDFRKGQIYGKTEILKGGWCEIFIKGMREPIFRSINIEEVLNRKSDGTPNKFWKEKPALMIEKVAQKQAMEIAMQMPKTYIEEELPIDTTYEDLSGQKAISENNKEFFETK
jgi:hypothetical protein